MGSLPAGNFIHRASAVLFGIQAPQWLAVRRHAAFRLVLVSGGLLWGGATVCPLHGQTPAASPAATVAAPQGMVTREQFIRELSPPVPPPAAAPPGDGLRARGFTPRGMAVVPATPTPAPQVSVMILFKFGTSEIADDASRAQLREAGQALASAELSRGRFEIEGHTDDVGRAEDNQSLSQRRAEAVVGILREGYGIAPTRLRALGKGEAEPVAPNSTAEGRARNRRVVFRRVE